MIFSNNLFKNFSFQQKPLKKPVEKLGFSNATLSNFQPEINIFSQQPEAEMKNRVAYKKKRVHFYLGSQYLLEEIYGTSIGQK